MGGVSVEPPTTATVAQLRSERRGVARRSVIEEAKARVETVALADLLCGSGQMRRVGARWVARCPLPGHDDRTPSFTVYPETNSWYCFGACQRGGDVVDLGAAAWQIERADVAAAEVLMTFGHGIPERPQSWYARQERQKPIRDKIADVRTEVLMRHLFRWIFEPMLAAIEGDEERARMGDYVWAEVLPLAARMVQERKGTS
jgi:DNA primase